jgi:hypothetical protein
MATAKRGITVQCTGAAKPGVFTWTIHRRGPVIADVRSLNHRKTRVTTLRFRSTETTLSAALIARLRQLTQLPMSEIRDRAKQGEPLLEVSAFTNQWQDDRHMLLELARGIESNDLPFTVTEVYEDGSESDVSLAMLRNLIDHFRGIELETQRDTMLELGEIEHPDQFEPYDEDWTK